jgi:hypothetical protein
MTIRAIQRMRLTEQPRVSIYSFDPIADDPGL